MDSPQQATLLFFGPVAVAYLVAASVWLIYDLKFPGRWLREPLPPSSRPYRDFFLAIIAAAGIGIFGALYRAGWLLPTGDDWTGRLGWTIDNLIIFSPLAVVLIARRQGLETVFACPKQVVTKITAGVVLGVLAVSLYHVLRGELLSIDNTLRAALSPEALSNFVPVFLEGVAIAFLFVRLRWAFGHIPSLVVPALLFAASHVPGSIADGESWAKIVAFFLFNSALTVALLYVIQRSQDVIWFGIIHYLMDVAIKAFE